MSTGQCHSDILNIVPSKILFYGNSHVGRFSWWRVGSCGKMKPTMLEDTVLKNSEFTFSGGSTWANIDTRVRGIDLAFHQQQEYTWTPILDSEFVPDYVYYVVGSNSIDKLNDEYVINARKGKYWEMIMDRCVHTGAGPSEYLQKCPYVCDVVRAVKKATLLRLWIVPALSGTDRAVTVLLIVDNVFLTITSYPLASPWKPRITG